MAIYFEAAAVIVVLVLLGQVLELRARSRTGTAIKALLNLAPPTARLIADGGDKEVPLDQVKVGDHLRVVPGDKIPVITFAVWMWLGPEPRLAHAIVNAVAVLIIACPCALGLATPMSIMVGVGRGAQLGVLIKNAEALERLEHVDMLVVDKTGTLTEGKPRLTDILPAEGFDEKDFLLLAASLEQGSEHPLAAAIVRGAKDQHMNLHAVKDFRSVTAGGVVGAVSDHVVMVGKPDFLRNEKIVGLDSLEASAMQSAGITLVKGDLRGIAQAIRLSRATMRNIRQNLVFAFGYNALGIPIAAGVLYPFFGLLLSPIIAGAAMSLSSVSVISNALRLRSVNL